MPCCVIVRRRLIVAFCVLWAGLFLHSSFCQAQLPQTRLYAVYPQGAQVGQTVEVTVSNGADLDELDRMTFSHPGIKAVHKSGNTFSVTVAADVTPGVYDARVHGLYGTSNPRSFVVGSLPEVLENDANESIEKAQPVEIGTLVNGRSNRGADVDFYKISGKKGQRVLIECQALRIDSKFQGELRLYSVEGRRIGRSIARLRTHDPILDVTLPDDGDFFIRATDFVYGGSNDYGYRLKIHAGPHVDFVVPPAGVPGSTARYTLVGRNLPGSTPAGISADGRQLEKLDVEITLPDKPTELNPGETAFSFEATLDGAPYVFRGANGVANPVTIAFAPQALSTEVEPNDEPAAAQKISVPAEIAGQFQRRVDVDQFEFEAKAGQVFWIEVFGQQLGQLTDPVLTVEQVTRKEDGTETVKRLTALDDATGNAIDNLFDTAGNDPAYRLAVPADSLYRVTVQDRYWESRGNPELQYHLAIREEEPDFRLVVVPPAPLQNSANGYQTWAPGVRKGENLHVELAAIRRHGFKGVIDVVAEGLPAGVTCKPVSIDGAATSANLVFSVSEDAQPGEHSISIVGEARIESNAAVKAVEAAQAALTKAQAALPPLETALQKTIDPRDKAEAARKSAETVATADAAAVKQLSEAKLAAAKKLEGVQAEVKTAAAEKATADKAVETANTAVASAEAALKAAQGELDKDKENAALKEKLAAATTAREAAGKALQAAQEAAKVAGGKLSQLETQAKAEMAAVDKVAQELAKAEQKAKQSDAALKAAVAAHESAVAAFTKAEQAKKAGEAALAAASADLETKKKAQEAAARNVKRPARAGTVVWNGSNQQPAVSRISHALKLSIMDEASPYQTLTSVDFEVLGHNRQLLVPVKLIKRNGFDEKVQLTFQNVPKNLQVQNLAIDKGKDEALLRVFVPNNVAEGTYTMFLQAQGQVSYQKNPKRLERATEAQKAADAALKAATDAAAAAKAAATKAATELTAATNAEKAAQQKVDAAKKAVDEAGKNSKAAVDAKAAADKAASDARKKLDEATAAVEAAKAASDKAADDEALAQKLKETQQAQSDAQKALDAATKAASDAAAAAEAAEKTATTAAAAAAEATKELTESQGAVAKATEAKKTADAAVVAADAKVKAETAAKAAADKEHKDATAYTKANKVNVYAPSTPIVFKVRKAAFSLTISGGGDLKRGAVTDVKVTVKRENNYTGPVTVSLAVPPGTKGLSAPPVTIPADQTEAVLKVSAAGDATEGDIANLVVRGTADWDGPVSADQTVKIKVVK